MENKVKDTEVMDTVVTVNEVTDHKTADTENNLPETVNTKSADFFKKFINFVNPLLFIFAQVKLSWIYIFPFYSYLSFELLLNRFNDVVI